MKQVNKEHYDIKYLSKPRMMSYWYQIHELLKLNTNSLLEIGVGDKIFASYIKNNTKISYKSLDVDEQLNPDFLGSVKDIKLPEKFDTVCAFEVLEHLPFEDLPMCLENINNMSTKSVLISLPYYGPYFRIAFRLPIVGEFTFLLKIKWFKPKHEFNGQHHWEIGKKNYDLNTVRSIIGSVFKIKNEFLIKENPYHYFFISQAILFSSSL